MTHKIPISSNSTHESIPPLKIISKNIAFKFDIFINVKKNRPKIKGIRFS